METPKEKHDEPLDTVRIEVYLETQTLRVFSENKWGSLRKVTVGTELEAKIVQIAQEINKLPGETHDGD